MPNGPDPVVTQNHLNYIQQHVADFRALQSKLVQMQHRAAIARNVAMKQGRVDLSSAFYAQIGRIGTLRNYHARALQKIDELNWALDKIGAGTLGGFFIPAALAILAAGIVVYMVTTYEQTNLEERRLSLAERALSGTSTPEQLDTLRRVLATAPDPKRDSLGGKLVDSIVRPVALGLVAVVVVPRLIDSFRRHS